MRTPTNHPQRTEPSADTIGLVEQLPTTALLVGSALKRQWSKLKLMSSALATESMTHHGKVWSAFEELSQDPKELRELAVAREGAFALCQVFERLPDEKREKPRDGVMTVEGASATETPRKSTPRQSCAEVLSALEFEPVVTLKAPLLVKPLGPKSDEHA